MASFFLSVLQLDVLNGFAPGLPHRGVSHGASQEIGAVVRQCSELFDMLWHIVYLLNLGYIVRVVRYAHSLTKASVTNIASIHTD